MAGQTLPVVMNLCDFLSIMGICRLDRLSEHELLTIPDSQPKY